MRSFRARACRFRVFEHRECFKSQYFAAPLGNLDREIDLIFPFGIPPQDEPYRFVSEPRRPRTLSPREAPQTFPSTSLFIFFIFIFLAVDTLQMTDRFVHFPCNHLSSSFLRSYVCSRRFLKTNVTGALSFESLLFCTRHGALTVADAGRFYSYRKKERKGKERAVL